MPSSAEIPHGRHARPRNQARVKEAAESPFTLSRESRTLERSMMRDLIAVTARPGIVSFAGGLPAPELFPIEAWRSCSDTVLRLEGRSALQYGPPFAPLQDAIAELMRRRGAAVSAEQVFLVTGAQQGLHVVARLLMDADSAAVVDEFVFTGVRQAFGGPDRELRDVKANTETGMAPDAFERALAASPRPRAAVVIPDFHNPMGTSLDDSARDAVIDASARYGVPIVEDDPYGLLAFGGAPSVPLVAREPDRVLYIGSFSKLIAPALRLGWVVAPVDLVGRLRVLKESVDLECSAWVQRTLSQFLAEGFLDAHLAVLRTAYLERRDAMLAALALHFPAGTRWSVPGGGMFIWAELPEGYDTMALLEQAVAAGVAYVPGGAFASVPAPRTMRLNFSNASPEVIAAGIEKLGAVLHSAEMAEPVPA